MDPVRPWLWANPRGLRLRDCTPRDREVAQIVKEAPIRTQSAMEMIVPRIDHLGNPIGNPGTVPYEYTLFSRLG